MGCSSHTGSADSPETLSYSRPSLHLYESEFRRFLSSILFDHPSSSYAPPSPLTRFESFKFEDYKWAREGLLERECKRWTKLNENESLECFVRKF
ncbi:hypothetical protein CEXT_432921 [Caerostris extrusa]|uniref:Maturase K n=1 Tax=Caerostris extrusa TaxID=172846 RepID=A0AAV4MQV3_CAEEX|nr:hypothetical protein CEXT_432921 [Caerostris extrusa]